MKRKILFRGYNLKNKKWLYGYYLVNRGQHFIAPDGVQPPGVTWEDFEVDPESVGQKIGEMDGVDLYEGDIVDMVLKSQDAVFCCGMIYWDGIYCEYRLKTTGGGVGHMLSFAENLFRYEIVGNEYEERMKSEQSE